MRVNTTDGPATPVDDHLGGSVSCEFQIPIWQYVINIGLLPVSSACGRQSALWCICLTPGFFLRRPTRITKEGHYTAVVTGFFFFVWKFWSNKQKAGRCRCCINTREEGENHVLLLCSGAGTGLGAYAHTAATPTQTRQIGTPSLP